MLDFKLRSALHGEPYYFPVRFSRKEKIKKKGKKENHWI